MQYDVAKLKVMIEHLAQVMHDNKQQLIELDSVMGDSDLGLTMDKIFSQAHQEMKNSEETDAGKFLFKVGTVMAGAAPSTMGTLVASGFMQAGKSLKNKTELEIEDWVLFASAFRDGIANRGKASVGEKTILDVLDPVATSLANKKFADIKELFECATTVAKDALEHTKTLQAQHGRAAYYGEKSIGHQDAGATVGYLIYKGIEECGG